MKNTSSQINDQKEMVEYTASDPNAAKGAEKTLTGLETEKKTLQKQNENQGKNIDSRNKEIRKEKRNTTSSQQNQALKMTEIEKQKQKVQTVQAKLDNIK